MTSRMRDWPAGEVARWILGLCPACGEPPEDEGVWFHCRTCSFKLCYECSIDRDYYLDGQCYHCSRAAGRYVRETPPR